MSIEASADIARGIVALLGRIPAHDSPFARRLAAHLATCVVTLRQAVGQYDRDASAVAWLARVIHAIILADASFPLGVQRLASLKWPLEGGLAEVASGWEESLIATLAAQNSDFRRRNHELDRERLAARVGRATATVVSTAVLASVAVLLFLKLGTKSPLGVLANLAWLLSTLLASLGATFQLLNHWDLLAAPAQPALAWAKKATEVLPDFGKFKSRSER